MQFVARKEQKCLPGSPSPARCLTPNKQEAGQAHGCPLPRRKRRKKKGNKRRKKSPRGKQTLTDVCYALRENKWMEPLLYACP